MKKFILSILLFAFVSLLFPFPAASAEPSGKAVSSASDLLAIGSDPYGSYFLASDIDMSGIDWKAIPFHGTFNGNGHVIYNLTVRSVSDDHALTYDGNMKPYEYTRFASLFSLADDAVIKDLSLKSLYKF